MCSPGDEQKRMDCIEQEPQCVEIVESDSGRDSASESQASPSAFRSASTHLQMLDPFLMQQQLIALLSTQLGSLPGILPSLSVLPNSLFSNPIEIPTRGPELPSLSEENFTLRDSDPTGDDQMISSTSGPPSCDQNDSSFLDSGPAITPNKRQPLDYAERRRRNNDSARRSREIRRQRELENRQKSESLEKENEQLKQEVLRLRAELARLTLAVLQQQQQQQQGDKLNIT